MKRGPKRLKREGKKRSKFRKKLTEIKPWTETLFKIKRKKLYRKSREEHINLPKNEEKNKKKLTNWNKYNRRLHARSGLSI